MILKHERDPNWLPRLIGAHRLKAERKKWSRTLRLAAGIAVLAVVGLLFLPPPKAAQARLIDISPEGDAGGYRICLNFGYGGASWGYCWHTEIPLLSPETVPRPGPMMPAHEKS